MAEKKNARRIIGALVRRLLCPAARRLCPSPKRTVNLPPSIRIRSPQETLDACAECIRAMRPGAYLRFGDGDVNLMQGIADMMQEQNERLAGEMREAFSLSGQGILKSLPLHAPRFGIYPGMAPGIHGVDDAWAERLLARCYGYFIGEPIYSSVALPYLAAFDRPAALDFLRILKASRPVFVGNGEVPDAILRQLFGNGERVATPPKNAFAEIDRIEHDVLKILQSTRQFRVVVLAMGCSGRVLAKRILARNESIFAFDFGSLLDALCGWNTRAWIGMAPNDCRELLNLID